MSTHAVYRNCDSETKLRHILSCATTSFSTRMKLLWPHNNSHQYRPFCRHYLCNNEEVVTRFPLHYYLLTIFKLNGLKSICHRQTFPLVQRLCEVKTSTSMNNLLFYLINSSCTNVCFPCSMIMFHYIKIVETLILSLIFLRSQSFCMATDPWNCKSVTLLILGIHKQGALNLYKPCFVLDTLFNHID